jgi:hypothetical protein
MLVSYRVYDTELDNVMNIMAFEEYHTALGPLGLVESKFRQQTKGECGG